MTMGGGSRRKGARMKLTERKQVQEARAHEHCGGRACGSVATQHAVLQSKAQGAGGLIESVA